MKNRITAILICITMLFACGCGNTASTKVKKPAQSGGKTQTVIAMNPAIVSEDGTVKSARKTVSDSISADYKGGTLTFYDNTNWQWLYADGEESYIRRSIRGIESYKDGSGNTVKGMSYVYSVTDDRTSSLTVYDTAKMKISEYSGDTLAPSGILMTFTGTEKEAFAYTADSDCTLTLCDTENGSISLIKSVADNSTDILNSDKAAGVVLGVSLNGRLLWQEVLGNEALLGKQVTSVAFPSLSGLSLSAGDTILISAQTVESADGVETGYFDIPGGTSVVNKSIKIRREVEVKNDLSSNAEKGISFINENGESRYAVITGVSTNSDVSEVANGLRNRIQDIIGTDVVYARDSSEIEYPCKILLGDTKYAESIVAKNELINGRKYNAADFIIRTVGNNVVINALNAVSMQTAVDYFMNNYCTSSKAAVPEKLNYVSSKHNAIKTPTIAGNDLSKYRIVYSEYLSYIEKQGIDYLQRELIKLTGCNLPLVTDDTSAVPYEIVIGTTRRTSSDYYKKSTLTDSNNYTVKVSGGKMYIGGDQAHATDAAIHKTVELLKTVSDFGEGYNLSGKYDGGYSLTNGYKLAWSDEFNGDKLQPLWATPTQLSHYDLDKDGKSDHYSYEIQECSYLENGSLVQRMFSDDHINYYGGAVRSNGKDAMLYQYGYCEIRVKYGTTLGAYGTFILYGEGTHPNTHRYAEIDIVETFGRPWQLARTIHGWGTQDPWHGQWGGGDSYKYKKGTNEYEPWGNEYHTIGLEWERDFLRFTVDGVEVSYFDCSSPVFEFLRLPAAVHLSSGMDISGQNGIPRPDTSKPWNDYSYVDYVRIYQKADNGSVINRGN